MITLIFILLFQLQAVRDYIPKNTVIQSNNKFTQYKLEFADFVLRNLNTDSKFAYQLLNRDSVDYYINKMYKEIK